MSYLNELAVERILLERFAALGYEHQSDKVIGPDGALPERLSHADVVLEGRLRAAVERLNPGLPRAAREEALRWLGVVKHPSLLGENQRLHRALIEGVPVEYRDDEGVVRHVAMQVLDFVDPVSNDWLVVDQFTVVEGEWKRRPDVVVFVNGLPLAVVELKNPSTEQATLATAFNQLQTYKDQVPSLFRTNAALVTTDGVTARVGSLTANEERFMPWRTVDGSVVLAKGAPELDTLIEGVFEPGRFLELLRDFTVFLDTGNGVVKILAGYHQFHAVKHAVGQTVKATAPGGDRRVGVIWHTQGSGKSLLMAFYTGKLAQHPGLENPTIVVITDRNDLDDQLYTTFAGCRDLIRQTPVQAESRSDLQKALQRASGGVVFTTIQKFAPPEGEPDYPVLTERRNVVVIADEAHRSQYGFRARVEQKTGEISYGFAKYLRDALPNASFIGFTGTPIERDDVNTPAVFGEYIDVYDISQAVEDGATVPIFYESRLARIELPEDRKPVIDAAIEVLTEDEALEESEQLKRKWATVEALVGAENRLKLVAQDLVWHFEDRLLALDGKAMVVCMSRRICVALYHEIVCLRPGWHSEDPKQGLVKVVMTGSASDPQEWQQHIGNAARRELISKRMKDPEDSLKLVLVRDMWLTGFDAPSLHTTYVDKPMHGHGLMQAIARVNRVFKDKPAGLVVDYIGIAQSLKTALGQYSKRDQQQAGIDQAEAVAVLLEKLDVVRSMFHGFDYSDIEGRTPLERLSLLAGAIDFIQCQQRDWAALEESDEGKKRAHRRFQDAVLALTKAFALVSASDEAAPVRVEVGFFQAVRAALVKTDPRARSDAAAGEAIRQLIDQAVTSTEIVDILKAVGMESPDIGILSEQFLADIQAMKQKNLAFEALKKLLGDEIRSRSKTNVVEGKKFSERLEQAISRYHTNAVTTAEVIAELIRMAKDLKASMERDKEHGLTPDEVAFYDALAENDSAVKVLGVEELRVIAQLVLDALKRNVTVDWARRQSARANLRVIVKDILEEHGYPPDLSVGAVQTVLQQAEALSLHWTQ